MKNYQRAFIEFAISQNALLFGEFTLKSGRNSPYFFNMGCFKTGAAIRKIGQFYAEAILAHSLNYDVLFGPAYKGIPLVTATAIALAEKDLDKPYTFNRKEPKDHGEGGTLVGAQLTGKILMVDDVISAGTTVKEVIPLVQQQGAQLSHIVIALDRQERGLGHNGAIKEIEQTYDVAVTAIIQLVDIIEYLKEHHQDDYLNKMLAYREAYGEII
ncbi:MAG: orotate phosphoribosyltransferase [Gammaproteobacteria bacterium]